MGRPLEGIRVLDFTWAQQGPYATTLLADMGAEVIKVEHREGERGRGVGGRRSAPTSYFVAHNRGKHSVTLDVRRPEAREVVHRFVERVDVVVSNMRPGAMDRLGFDYDSLSAINPRIIYASASAFGPHGDRTPVPGNDIIGQASGGIMLRSGPEDGPPTPTGAAIADQVGAMMLCSGILAAVVKRERTGEGEQVDVSLYGSQIALQSWEINTESFSGDTAPRAGLGHPLLTSRSVWRSYETADGWLVIGGATTDKFAALCDELGLNDLAERYPDDRSRAAGMLDIHPHLAKAIRAGTTDEWIARFRARDIFCGPVQTYGDILADPQARANGYIATMPHAAYGEALVVGCPIQFGGEPQTEVAPPPELGDSTERYLTELGYSWDEIESLREAGVT